MKLALLTICTLVLECQSLRLKNLHRNPEQMYFNDNIPSNLQINNPNLRGENDSQPNSPQTQAQLASDSYLRAQLIQQQQKQTNQDANIKILNQPANQNQNDYGNQYPNQNGNHQFQPSLEVLPPKDSSQDYYGTKQLGQVKTQGLPSADVRSSVQTSAGPLVRNNVMEQEMRLASLTISHIGIYIMRSAFANQTNAVVSPLSVVNMLALLQAGATGETQRQISEALQLTPEMSLGIFRLMNRNFAKRGSQSNVLRSANSIFSAEAFELSKEFKNIAVQDFGSEVSRISFQNSAAAAQQINSWIASKTNNKIDKVVSPDSIGVNTQLVLANAVYFKGLWETMFSTEQTTEGEFHLSNGQKKSVPFMSLRSGFKCGLDKTANALVAVLPFEAKEYSLVLLLPTPNANVRDVLTSLTGEKLLEYQNIRTQDVLLEIPRFTVRADTNMQPVFTKMGITKMFSGASELNNIGLYRTSSPQVSSAVHSAMMAVDERGATAAASTVVAAVALSYDIPSIVFKADRPFLAVLWDNQLSMPLFMAQIENPMS